MKFKIPSLFKNIYFIIIMLFIIWMLFFDSNSWLVHRELNKKVYKLENQKDFYTEGIRSCQLPLIRPHKRQTELRAEWGEK